MKPIIENDDMQDTCADTCETVHKVKEKLSDIQEEVVTYVKENPVKAIGISVLAGIVVAQLFRKHK